ncbi:NAD(P)H-quinone oxidoreductase [Solimonas sp. K1W22B-7]|uniref:NAD(P)H-quinone oxidoreductase n=1 Tax=Solimonas sp. K1W22B-7 TaxID=2303331 RepID=UPI000E3359C3|nr:NAD(P)H-quinone oxidoreductase [Solimonas sp. K1W22B-7]AXQ28485.1 NAD(P)H-quinone oxidoreductase [Solimonas sp. K1W22B-7]
MRAIEISEPGGPEVLRLCERERPVPTEGEVLIRVTAAGVNRPDLLQRAGQYRAPADASDLPGLEVAGEIVGGDVGTSGLRIGDRVCALVHGGGYAEYCRANAAHCLPLPAGWSELEAATLPETCFTVWSNVFERAALAPGESLLVQGGSSGIGVTAIQIAQALGHRVFATAGSEEKVRACVALGAERAINYREADFVAEIRRLTDGRGVDVILDMVGGDYVGREIGCLADDGRLVLIGLLGGAKGSLPLAEILLRRLTLSGSTLRPRSNAYKASIASALRARVWPLIEAGRIRPVVHRVFPLEQAAEAHRLMEGGSHIGKLVLAVG